MALKFLAENCDVLPGYHILRILCGKFLLGVLSLFASGYYRSLPTGSGHAPSPSECNPAELDVLSERDCRVCDIDDAWFHHLLVPIMA